MSGQKAGLESMPMDGRRTRCELPGASFSAQNVLQPELHSWNGYLRESFSAPSLPSTSLVELITVCFKTQTKATKTALEFQSCLLLCDFCRALSPHTSLLLLRRLGLILIFKNYLPLSVLASISTGKH